MAALDAVVSAYHGLVQGIAGPTHDRDNADGGLAMLAALYASRNAKPANSRRAELIKAAGLLICEIDRLDRLTVQRAIAAAESACSREAIEAMLAQVPDDILADAGLA